MHQVINENLLTDSNTSLSSSIWSCSKKTDARPAILVVDPYKNKMIVKLAWVGQSRDFKDVPGKRKAGVRDVNIHIRKRLLSC